jgi:hypothetical protein
LNSVRTVEKLQQVWPEIIPFTRDLAVPVKTNLPALNISEVNAMLGLPKEA